MPHLRYARRCDTERGKSNAPRGSPLELEGTLLLLSRGLEPRRRAEPARVRGNVDGDQERLACALIHLACLGEPREQPPHEHLAHRLRLPEQPVMLLPDDGVDHLVGQLEPGQQPLPEADPEPEPHRRHHPFLGVRVLRLDADHHLRERPRLVHQQRSHLRQIVFPLLPPSLFVLEDRHPVEKRLPPTVGPEVQDADAPGEPGVNANDTPHACSWYTLGRLPSRLGSGFLELLGIHARRVVRRAVRVERHALALRRVPPLKVLLAPGSPAATRAVIAESRRLQRRLARRERHPLSPLPADRPPNASPSSAPAASTRTARCSAGCRNTWAAAGPACGRTTRARSGSTCRAAAPAGPAAARPPRACDPPPARARSAGSAAARRWWETSDTRTSCTRTRSAHTGRDAGRRARQASGPPGAPRHASADAGGTCGISASSRSHSYSRSRARPLRNVQRPGAEAVPGFLEQPAGGLGIVLGQHRIERSGDEQLVREILPALRLPPPAGGGIECGIACIGVILVRDGSLVKVGGNPARLGLVAEVVQVAGDHQDPGAFLGGEPRETRRRLLDHPGAVSPAEIAQLGHALRRRTLGLRLEYAEPLGEPARSARLRAAEAVPHLLGVAERLLVVPVVQRAARPPAAPVTAPLGMPDAPEHLGDGQRSCGVSRSLWSHCVGHTSSRCACACALPEAAGTTPQQPFTMSDGQRVRPQVAHQSQPTSIADADFPHRSQRLFTAGSLPCAWRRAAASSGAPPSTPGAGARTRAATPARRNCATGSTTRAASAARAARRDSPWRTPSPAW